MNGRHRSNEHKFYDFHYPVPITLDKIRPFDILLTRQKSLLSAVIVAASMSDGHYAWLGHGGQIKADARTVSEANYPYHQDTPIEAYLEEQEKGKVRLTIVRLKDSLWPDISTQLEAYGKCEQFHNTLNDRSLSSVMKGHGAEYDGVALLPMLLVSILRNSNPFFKRGKWNSIPQKYQTAVLICSAIIKWGFAWAQQKLKIDFFPSSLSLTVPSPQDIFDSPHTEYVCGWIKLPAKPADPAAQRAWAEDCIKRLPFEEQQKFYRKLFNGGK